MKIKVLIILVWLLLVQLVSCDISDRVYQIENISLTTIDINNNPTSEFNSASGIHFKIETEERQIASNQNGFFGVCYAVHGDPGRYVQNPLDTATFILRLDKTIIFDQDTIQPGRNLLSSNYLKPYVYFYQLSGGWRGTTFFRFKEEGEYI